MISSLGLRNAFKSGGLIANAMRALVPAMQRAGVRRLLIVSANGVGETFRHSPLLLRQLADRAFVNKGAVLSS